jgi:spore coat-associated protein N
MNRKIIFSSMSIVAALSLMGGSAFAAFTSSASNTGNTFGAGSITLTLNGQSGSGSTALFTLSNKVPGDSSLQSIVLANAGNVNSASTKVTAVTSNSTGGTNSVVLGDKLMLTLFDDANSNDAVDSGEELASYALTDSSWTNKDLGFGLNAGDSKPVKAKLVFDSSAGNDYQGASTTFSISFQTSQ